MKYDLITIMRRAWELRRSKGYTMTTALRLAWAEAKGEKVYVFHLEDAKAAITDIHQQHKYNILRAALLIPCDTAGLAVMEGKTVGLCKYACRNA